MPFVRAARLRALVIAVAVALSTLIFVQTATADPASAPVVTGVASVGSTLTVQTSGWESDDVAPTVQWFADDVAIGSATATTFVATSAQVGRRLRVDVTRTRGGVTETATSDPTLRVATSSQPRITGTTVVNDVLTADPGAWTPGTEYSFEWRTQLGTVMGTGKTLRLTPDLRDRRLTVTVTGTKADHTTLTRESAFSSYVMAPSTPNVSGTLLVGQTLRSSVPSRWSSATTWAYQWYADGRAIGGATGATLRLPSSVAGRQISLHLKGSQAGYPSVVKYSARTLRVVTTAPTPSIAGAVASGRQLKAHSGTWKDGMTVAYRWYADGKPIDGATWSTYTPSVAMRGKQLTVHTAGKRSGYPTIVRTSRATARVQLVGGPSISGTSQATGQATANPGTWTQGTTFSYVWYLEGSRISTSRTVTVLGAWRGKRLRVEITGRQSGYQTFTTKSGWTRPVSLPSRTDPVDSWNCPSWAPIKGNANSGIYHVPGGAYYDRTKPEECFTTESAAVAAGYRRSQR